MKTTVVTGMLGAGKTSFIRHVLKGAAEKTVVLVNDFGQAGIDGEIFSAAGIESVELPSGCVCCTLKFDLITTVQRIVKRFSPDHLVIEPSGVASPSGVLEALAGAGISAAAVIGIVDAVEFAELYDSGMYGSFFEDQLVNADVILVNKTDLADEALIAGAERKIGAVNPRAILFRTVNAELGSLLPAPSPGRTVMPGSSHFRFESVSIPLSGTPPAAAVRSFLQELTQGRFGSAVRAKALVHTAEGPYRFDVTYGKIDAARFEKDVTNSRVVVIGERLDRKALFRALAPHSSS